MSARTIGIALSVIIALYILFNVARATLDPAGFAAAFGAPLADPRDAGFVFVYAVRSLFLSAIVLVLLAMRQIRAVALFALTAVLMPLGDAAIAASAGASTLRIAIHLGIGGLLLVTGLLLLQPARSGA
jgi:hypothetical protein